MPQHDAQHSSCWLQPGCSSSSSGAGLLEAAFRQQRLGRGFRARSRARGDLGKSQAGQAEPEPLTPRRVKT